MKGSALDAGRPTRRHAGSGVAAGKGRGTRLRRKRLLSSSVLPFLPGRLMSCDEWSYGSHFVTVRERPKERKAHN